MHMPTTFEVIVAGHTGLYFHVGNTIEDTSGCILVGRGLTQSVLYSSRAAFEDFLKATDSVDNFDISIEHL